MSQRERADDRRPRLGRESGGGEGFWAEEEVEETWRWRWWRRRRVNPG